MTSRDPAPGPPGAITFLTNIPNPHMGFVYEELRRRGHPVDVFFKGLPGSEGRPWDLEPVAPDRVASNIWQEREAFRGTRHGVPNTIVLCGSWSTPRDGLRRLMASKAHLAGAGVVTWGEALSLRNSSADRLRQLYYSRPGLDTVLAIGNFAVDSYRHATRGRIPIHVLPYSSASGLDVDPCPTAEPIVGFAGRLIELKGVDVAIRALAALPRGDRPRFEVAGSGELEPRLRELAHRLEVDVTFLGELAPDQLAATRARWRVALVPSQQIDGWALVVPESLNSAVPVLASGFVGAAHDLIRDGWNGQMIPRDLAADPEAWASAITALLDGGTQLSQNARAVGRAFAPHEAARWLSDLLDAPAMPERSFVEDAWARLPAQ